MTHNYYFRLSRKAPQSLVQRGVGRSGRPGVGKGTDSLHRPRGKRNSSPFHSFCWETTVGLSVLTDGSGDACVEDRVTGGTAVLSSTTPRPHPPPFSSSTYDFHLTWYPDPSFGGVGVSRFRSEERISLPPTLRRSPSSEGSSRIYVGL